MEPQRDDTTVPPPGPESRLSRGQSTGTPEYIAFNVFMIVMVVVLLGIVAGVIR